MATGLLVLGSNSSTRLLTYLVGLDKEYLATIRLGAATTTDDAEGELIATATPDARRGDRPTRRSRPASARSPAPSSRCRSSSARSRSTASAPTPGRGRARRSSSAARRSPSRPSRCSPRTRRRRLRSTSTCASSAPPAPTSAPSPATSARRSASAGTSPPCAAPASARSRWRMPPRLDDLDVAAALIRPADVAARLFPALALSEQQAIDLGHGKRIERGPAQRGSRRRRPDRRRRAGRPPRRPGRTARVDGGSRKSVVNFPTTSDGGRPHDPVVHRPADRRRRRSPACSASCSGSPGASPERPHPRRASRSSSSC